MIFEMLDKLYQEFRKDSNFSIEEITSPYIYLELDIVPFDYSYRSVELCKLIKPKIPKSILDVYKEFSFWSKDKELFYRVQYSISLDTGEYTGFIITRIEYS